ncbi:MULTISPECIES: hypothetical protein [unclassified Haladaptatus]|uniref:hypothetical protein n=1 Tax=unclassified Haladaptatus TaxID=2622732 RepID=UPI0023E8506A|nr:MULTISPECIES: hypothetical protein [unclassified Haladaptatus]
MAVDDTRVDILEFEFERALTDKAETDLSDAWPFREVHLAYVGPDEVTHAPKQPQFLVNMSYELPRDMDWSRLTFDERDPAERREPSEPAGPATAMTDALAHAQGYDAIDYLADFATAYSNAIDESYETVVKYFDDFYVVNADRRERLVFFVGSLPTS